MKKFFCALLLMTAVVGGENVFAQFKGNIWCFGDSAGINFTPPMSFLNRFIICPCGMFFN
ncbi:MAG: hypothetical protein IPP46_13775 [Bacteroidetes bacterium]|nr:hypothetical protein [Bacteroidota bacterium]